ncbi:MAG: DNA mismatch repair endonuclease MutL [Rhodothermales bacterium]|nr:DNA mismatch repair endonuclease MutL [Rhodothermales bacterium]MBO6780574.1 DNA mismatch repair endonuclease MutL [Rhodothermales bacterium]
MTGQTEEKDVSSSEQGIIRVMPDVLANKIAAGEVVGRPASVAKELVENALDAGATRIDIIVADSGRSLVQVVDNGSGMSAGDAVRCFQRHATSKIRDFDDLERIHTLGFRGEALASIGAVARVELKTRRAEDEVGTLVRVEGGHERAVEPCAQPTGTSVAVRQLFYNVPARRAFLKSEATEFSHIIDTVQMLALAHPSVGFSLAADGREVLALQACTGDGPVALAGRIRDLFAHEQESLLWVEERTSYLSVRGWIGQPEVRKRNRGEQFLLVNGRPIRSRYLEHAVYNSYRGLIPEGTFPFFTIVLDVDTRHVDVNVHPTKSEVRFDDERGVYSMLKAVVGRALSEGAGVLRFDDAGAVDLLAGSESSEDGYPALSSPTTPRAADPGSVSEALYAPTAGPEPAEQAEEHAVVEPERLVWQILGSYVVAPIRSGLLIVDQHAAHERVIFERALKALEDGFGLSQQLLFPTVVDFSAADFALLEGLLPDLRAIGFDLAVLSGQSVMVRGLPADIRPGDERGVLGEVLDQYKSFVQRLRLSPREMLARAMARRSAVPSDAPLDPREMRSLIDQLFQCREPYTSPAGRPTLIRITAEELARRFGSRA